MAEKKKKFKIRYTTATSRAREAGKFDNASKTDVSSKVTTDTNTDSEWQAPMVHPDDKKVTNNVQKKKLAIKELLKNKLGLKEQLDKKKKRDNIKKLQYAPGGLRRDEM